MILKFKLTDGTGEINLKDLLISKISSGFINKNSYYFNLTIEDLEEHLKKKLKIETDEYNEELIEFFVYSYNEKMNNDLYEKIIKIFYQRLFQEISIGLKVDKEKIYLTDGKYCTDCIFNKIWFNFGKKKIGMTEELKEYILPEWFDTLVINENIQKLFNALVDKNKIKKISKINMESKLKKYISDLIGNTLKFIESSGDKIVETIIANETNLELLKVKACDIANDFTTDDLDRYINNTIEFSYSNDYFTLDNFYDFLRKKGF